MRLVLTINEPTTNDIDQLTELVLRSARNDHTKITTVMEEGDITLALSIDRSTF